MSILNRVLAGSSEDSFKTATPISIESSKITFSMGAAPSEYVLLLVSNSISISNTNRAIAIYDTAEYDRNYGAITSTSTTYKNKTLSYVTASYENGVFTLTTTGSGSNHNYFDTNGSYILFYR